MKIDIEENLLEPNERDSTIFEEEINDLLQQSEGDNIKADIETLKSMGFDKKMINKVYILLNPESIERAVDFMTEIDGIYQHDFFPSSNKNEEGLCFICKNPSRNHIDYAPGNLLNDIQENNNNLINNKQIIGNLLEDEKNNDNNNIYGECQVCYGEINKEDKELNTMPCGHLFCTNCWFNYLRTLITEAKVDKMRCMEHGCNEIVSEEFIVMHISENENLIDKYIKFKKRSEIINDRNKKLCPNPDCDSFLQRSETTKYVHCEYGHEYCFNCLRPPHGDESCDYNLEQQFLNWKKGKRVKRCPRCQMYTEKNEGCNHMTCVSCRYQWCWLCEGQYNYGHYNSGKCAGHQFTKADNLDEINNNNDNNNNDNINNNPIINFNNNNNIINNNNDNNYNDNYNNLYNNFNDNRYNNFNNNNINNIRYNNYHNNRYNFDNNQNNNYNNNRNNNLINNDDDNFLNININHNNRNEKLGFGLYKIFKGIFPKIKGQVDFNDYDYGLWIKYFAMIIFLLFGFVLMEIPVMYNLTKEMYNDKYMNENAYVVFRFFVIIIVICLSISYEVLFTCLISPFILISIFYHPFFDKLLVFFGVGSPYLD